MRIPASTSSRVASSRGKSSTMTAWVEPSDMRRAGSRRIPARGATPRLLRGLPQCGVGRPVLLGGQGGSGDPSHLLAVLHAVAPDVRSIDEGDIAPRSASHDVVTQAVCGVEDVVVVAAVELVAAWPASDVVRAWTAGDAVGPVVAVEARAEPCLRSTLLVVAVLA